MERPPQWSNALTGIVSRSRQLVWILDQLRQALEVDMSILLTGETGVGKSLMARAVHVAGPRSQGPFMVIECPTLAESLVESELFGHEKGAFTGAEMRKKGKLELADEGTLFLDEVADLSMHAQGRLLGFLETRELVRVGGSKPIRVNTQLVLATNKKLEELIGQGKFREDLYFRINECELCIPPLRERPEDIPKLAFQFIKDANSQMSKQVTGIARAALPGLVQQKWPGNVRELRNVIRHAMAYTQSGELMLQDLQAVSRLPGPMPLNGPPRSLKEMERTHVEQTLRYAEWNKSRAAAMLGITRGTLDRKIRDHGLRKPARDDPKA